MGAVATIRVCPLCHEQAHDSDDYGPTLDCSHPPYDGIEPVEVEGRFVEVDASGGDPTLMLMFPLPDPEAWKRDVGGPALDEQIARHVERINWLALTCDERVAALERRRAASPTGFFFHDEMSRCMFDQMMAMRRMVGGGDEPELVSVPCSRCRETSCENATACGRSPGLPSPAGSRPSDLRRLAWYSK